MATLRWPFLWLFRLPEVRQQLVNEVVLLRGQALQNIFEVEGSCPFIFADYAERQTMPNGPAFNMFRLSQRLIRSA